MMHSEGPRRTAVAMCNGIRRPAVILAALVAKLAWSASAPAPAPQMLLLDGAVAGPAIVVVGERGVILRSTDNARTWQSANSQVTATLTGVAFAADARHGWAVGHDALILGTSDGGLTWAPVHRGESLQDSYLDVLALDSREVIAVGAYGLFVRTEDGGRAWTRRKVLADDYHLNAISRGPSGTLYLAGEHGTLMRSNDRGATWTSIPAPYDGSFYGVIPLDRRTLLAHGLRGRVYRSSDDGATWEQVPTPQPVLLATALQLRSNLVLMGGQARTLLLSRDYGKSVVPSAAAPATAIAALVEMPDGAILALGEAGATILAPP